MRRLGSALAAGVLALGLLAACGPGTAAGVDGDLVDDWPAFKTAVTAQPVAGACYSAEYTDVWSGDFASQTTDCAGPHWTETSYVGEFTGALAGRSLPPLSGSADLADTFATCASQTSSFLGGAWPSGYVSLRITLPGNAAWKGGARWFRCEVIGVSKDINEDYVQLSGSAKGALAAGGRLARTCSVLTFDSNRRITGETAVDCSQPHNTEFSGLYTLTGTAYPDHTTLDNKANAACKAVLGTFLGVSADKSHYFGWSWWNISEEDWTLGVRTGVCEITGYANGSSSVRFTGSAKGIGDRKPANWKP